MTRVCKPGRSMPEGVNTFALIVDQTKFVPYR